MKKYKLHGYTTFQGLKIAIENPKGSIRRGTDPDGNKWETKMQISYGYFVGTEGKDGEPVDCFIGDNTESQKVYVVHINNPENKKYDEDKVMIGFDTRAEALEAFKNHYDKPYKFLRDITTLSIDQLKEKLKSRAGKMIKGFSRIIGLFKGKKIKDLTQMNMFEDLNSNDLDNEVFAGKTVTKEGKTYQLKPSKDPSKLRLFRVDKDDENFSLFGEDTAPVKPQSKPAETAPKKKPKLFGEQINLFDQPKEEPKPEKKPEEEQAPEEKPSGSKGSRGGSGGRGGGSSKGSKKPNSLGAEDIKGSRAKRKKEREQLNKAVHELLNSKTDDQMTDEDKELLAKYSGRGGTDEISLNEYYTKSFVAEKIWDIVRKLGFKGGEFLEPSLGTGMFFHTAPADAIGTGVEIDQTSGRIANILYGDMHNVEIKPFEEYVVNSEGGTQQLVIGNCPFGVRGASSGIDREGRDDLKLKSHEQYFVRRGIDELKEGGILAMIVPTGIMDNVTNNQFRYQINQQAEFLGAIRMPTGAFDHAHATVTTDVVFFRKRPFQVIEQLENAPAEKKGELYDKMILDADFVSGNFFKNNPDYAIGKETKGQYDTKVWVGDVKPEDIDRVAGMLNYEPTDYTEFGVMDGSYANFSSSPQVGDIKHLNGRTYRFNENHRWERVKEDGLKNIDIDQELKDKLGVKNLAELRELENDISRVRGLNEEQLGLLTSDYAKRLSKELKSYKDKSEYKQAMFKEAVSIGLAIKMFREDLLSGKISDNGVAQRQAIKLEMLVYDFINKYGDLKEGAQLNKYLNRSEERSLVYLLGAVNNEGEISDFFKDPIGYYKIYKTEKTTGKLDNKDVNSIVNYLFQNSITADINTILETYKGEFPEDVHRDLLKDEDVFIDGKGGFAPADEVCLGDVYSKVDYWSERIADNNSRYENATDEEKELITLENKKLEDQIFEIKRRSGAKELNEMPINLFDAHLTFGIDVLNEYLKQDLGGLFPYEIDWNEKGKYYTFKDKWLADAYKIYVSKGGTKEDALDSAERNILKTMADKYFNSEDNHFQLLLLNKLNSISLKVRKDKSGDFNRNYARLKENLKDYLSGLDNADEIRDIYNRMYSNYIQKQYSQEPIEGLDKYDYEKIVATIDGREINARDKAGAHVWSTVRRMYDQGKGMIAHGVGLGKTIQGIVLTLMAKQTGRAKKPFIVTPKSVLLNWVEEINKWTKDVNVIVLGAKIGEDGKWNTKGITPAYVESQLLDVQNNDYDIILCSRETFSRIDISKDTKKKLVEEIVDKYIGEADSKMAKKKREKMLEAFTKATELTGKVKAYQGVTLDSLGVDMVIRDEAHDVKNFIGTINEELEGVSNPEPSQRSIHNFLASKIVRQQNNDMGYYMLTATPISNSPLEVFNMMLPFAENELGRINAPTIDDFVRNYAVTETAPTVSPDGRVEEKLKFTGWSSPEAIRDLFFRFIDYKTSDDVESVKANIKFPKETPNHVFTELNDGQKELMKTCQDRLWCIKYRQYDENRNPSLNMDRLQSDKASGILSEEKFNRIVNHFENKYLPLFEQLNYNRIDKDKPIDDIYFNVQHDMGKIASDLQWYKDASSLYADKIDDSYVETHSSNDKLTKLYNNVLGIYKSGNKQLIFAENKVLHPKIKEELIKQGIKESEIMIVNGDTMKTPDQRVDVSKLYNEGKYKVIIGNYATMGEGLNFQNMTSDIHHVQPAWNYLKIEQGNGRGVRQGNPLDEVNTHYYLAKGSIDAFMNQKVQEKGGMVDSFLRGDLSTWETDATMSLDEMMIELADNPEEARILLERQSAQQQAIIEDQKRSKRLRDFDRMFDIQFRMKNEKNKESKAYQSLHKQYEQYRDSLNTKDFEFYQHLNLDQKPIIMPEHNAVVPVGSVIQYGSDESEFTILDSFTPSSKRVQITTYKPGNYNAVETKVMKLQYFTEQYGKTITPRDMTQEDVFAEILDEYRTADYGLINNLPTHILKQNRGKIANNLLDSYKDVVYKDINGNFNIKSGERASKDIQENGGKVLIPGLDDDFIHALDQHLKSTDYRTVSDASEVARRIYGDNFRNKIKNILKKMRGESHDPEDSEQLLAV